MQLQHHSALHEYKQHGAEKLHQSKSKGCQPDCGSAAQDEAGGLQSAEGMSKLQADKAASDDRLSAMMAELQVFKQDAADAEVKSRADRKVSNI